MGRQSAFSVDDSDAGAYEKHTREEARRNWFCEQNVAEEYTEDRGSKAECTQLTCAVLSKQTGHNDKAEACDDHPLIENGHSDLRGEHVVDLLLKSGAQE